MTVEADATRKEERDPAGRPCWDRRQSAMELVGFHTITTMITAMITNVLSAHGLGELVNPFLAQYWTARNALGVERRDKRASRSPQGRTASSHRRDSPASCELRPGPAGRTVEGFFPGAQGWGKLTRLNARGFP